MVEERRKLLPFVPVLPSSSRILFCAHYFYSSRFGRLDTSNSILAIPADWISMAFDNLDVSRSLFGYIHVLIGLSGHR